MSAKEATVEVTVPVSTAYNQWTQFETFPHFMSGVDSITQLDDRRNHWVTSIAGVTREFDTEIVDQVPDQRIEWRSVDGPEHRGVVTFEPLDINLTRVTVLMDFEPEGFVEQAGDALGFVGGQIEGDLQRFKEFIESRDVETGAYREELQLAAAAAGRRAGPSRRGGAVRSARPRAASEQAGQHPAGQRHGHVDRADAGQAVQPARPRRLAGERESGQHRPCRPGHRRVVAILAGIGGTSRNRAPSRAALVARSCGRTSSK